MKRPSIFMYQFHRRRIIRAQSLYLYLITLSRHFTLSSNLIARSHSLAFKLICRCVAWAYAGETLPCVYTVPICQMSRDVKYVFDLSQPWRLVVRMPRYGNNFYRLQRTRLRSRSSRMVSEK